MIADATAKDIFDGTAAMYLKALSIFWDDSAESGTLAYAMNYLLAQVRADEEANDDWTLAQDLGAALSTSVTNAVMSAEKLHFLQGVYRRLENHVKERGSYADINAYLSDKSTKVHPFCRLIYPAIDISHTWPLSYDTTDGVYNVSTAPTSQNVIPTTNPFSTKISPHGKVCDVAFTGATTGTFTDGAALSSSYGQGKLAILVTSANLTPNGGDLTIQVDGTDSSGTAAAALFTVAAQQNQDTIILPSGGDDDYFADVTGVSSITHATGADTIDVIYRDERVLTLSPSN